MKIIQLWDDGIVSDIRLIEILKKHQAKASFCLNPGLYKEDRLYGWKYQNHDIWRLSINELADVYNGFEICSHSMTHPYLTELPEDQLYWELQTSKNILEEIFRKQVSGLPVPVN